MIAAGTDLNVKDDNVIEWAYPIPNRNFERFGKCREYEVSKGACSETNILEILKVKI